MKILSIDIGVKNFAMWVEEFDLEKLKELKKEFSSSFKTPVKRCDKNNDPTPEYNEFLKKFMVSSKTIFCQKIDFSCDEKYNKTKRGQVILDNNIYYSVIKKLDECKDKFDDVEYVVIEKQLKTNPNAQTIEHHVHAYFIHRYGLQKQVISFESRHKTRVLCCPKKIKKDDSMVKINKAYRKKWTTDKVMNVMLDRKDKETFEYVFSKNKSKADDLSDTLCQAFAFVILEFIE